LSEHCFSHQISSNGPSFIVSDAFSLNDKSGAKFMARFGNDGYLNLICTDFGRNQEMDLEVTSWFEDLMGKIESKIDYNLIFNESKPEHVLVLYGGSMMKDFANFAKGEDLFICIEIEHEAPIEDESEPVL